LASEYAYQLYYVYGGEAFNTSIKVGSKYYAQAVDAKGNPLTKKVAGKDVPVPNMKREIDPSKNVGVRALDAKTLKVYLQAPTPYFLGLTAFPTLMPVCKAVVSTNDKWASDVKTYVTDGPFTLTQWSHNDKMTFVKNPTYWDRDKVKLTKITYYMVDDAATALSMYQSGQLDSAVAVPLSEASKLVASGDATAEPFLATRYMLFNTTKKPFSDVRVRKALTLAINRRQITADVTRGGEIPALGFVSFGMPDPTSSSNDFRTAGGSYYKDNDIATAKALLAQAGYPNGKGFPAFAILSGTSQELKALGEAIQEMWKVNLGITCTFRPEESGVYMDDRNNGFYDVGFAQWSADYMDANTFLDIFQSGSGNNDTGWTSKAYDALIIKEKSTGDQKVRMKAMHDAETMLMANMPVMPIFFRTMDVLISKHVKNFYQSPQGFIDLKLTYMV
jgi:oligopeptide transport system substrate-binding protein